MDDATQAATPFELSHEAGPLCVPMPGTLWLEVDLRVVGCINLDFRDTAQRSIPLHLSLRRDEAQIIANRWTPKGWRRELALNAPLRRVVHVLRLDFRISLGTGASVALALDGMALGQLDAFPRPDKAARLGLRRGFPGLADLGWMTWPNGLRSLRSVSATPGPPLHLTPRLELGLCGPYAKAECDLGDGGSPLPFLPLDMAPDAKGMWRGHALLPGRIWQGSDAEGVTLIARDETGAEIARRNLRRADMLALMRRPEMPWLLRHDVLARLQMLEHVHFADLWGDVPPALVAILAPEVQRFGKAGFAPPAGVLAPALKLSPASAAGAACDAFHRALSDGQKGDPVVLFQMVACTARLDLTQIRQLVLMLSEWFCLHADPLALADAARGLGLADWGQVTDPWGQIAALPMLWATGNWAACRQVLRRARSQPPGWTVTPALGWIASALAQDWPDLQGARPALSQRTAMMSALMELIAECAPAYMSQMGCHRLIEGVCDVLKATADLPDWCAPRFAELALQAYGLNADFWRHLDAAAGSFPLRLTCWKSTFAHLYNACSGGELSQIAQAAHVYFGHPVAGRDMLRRIAMSDKALPRDAAGLPDTGALAGIVPQDQIEEAALRWLAFPRSRADRAALALSEGSAIHTAARAGLRAAASDVPRLLMSQALLDFGRDVQAVLAAIRSGRVPDALALSRIISRARTLSLPEADYTGLAALLALAEAFARAGCPVQAGRCIYAMIAEPDHLPQALVDCPALALALARFDALCPDAALRSRIAGILAPDPRLAPPPTEDALAAKLRAAANPFCDTLVALISCRAYLETRVPEIKSAWGDDLARLTIPLITVVGRAADQRPGSGPRFDGQLLELDAPDDYEGLPQKILALADWVLAQTGFGRVFKIDDDCFLDANAFFSDPAFLNSPYFGRPLHRNPGEMDRAWHMGRAHSARGRWELDKSPEPSVYADGGSGYCLSRPALTTLVAARNTVQGRALEQVSFMEDKLVGDLLALDGLVVTGPNYDIAIFRKSAPDMPPLPQYQNGFLPFAGSGIKLAHLDSGGDPMAARAALASPWPSPMKIWPCHKPAQLGWAKNALDLVTPPERLDQARDAELAVLSVMRNERFILDHFLAHYRRLGVTAFLIVDNGSEDGTLEHLAAQPDVSVFSTDTPYRHSAYGVMWQEALMAQFRLGRWSLLADADELAFWALPDSDGLVQGDLPSLLRGAEFAGADAVRMFMFDLYPKGPMSQARFTQSPFLEATHIDRVPLRHDWQGRGPWSNCATVTSALRHRLVADAGAPVRANLFVAQKYALLRYHPFLRLSTGLHYVAGAQVAPRDLGFAHFKYHAEFHAKAVAEVARGQHFNNAEEYRNYLALQAEGRETLFDPALSVRLSDCAKVRALCGLPEDPMIAAFRSAAPLRPNPGPSPRVVPAPAWAVGKDCPVQDIRAS